MGATAAVGPENTRAECSASLVGSYLAPSPQGRLHFRDHVWWMLLGLGCTWFLGDAINLQTAWWVDSQPEGDKIGAMITLAGSFAPITAGCGLLLRSTCPRCFASIVAPAMISMSLLSGYILGAGLWSVSSNFIYVSVYISQSVGAMVSFGMVPWILTEGFNPALISSLYFGGSLGSLSASVFAMIQQPGSAKLFSPTTFFLIITTPILGSAFAYYHIRRKNVGAISPGEMHANRPPMCSRQVLLNIRRWWRGALLLGLVSWLMAFGSWYVLRAALPYAAENIVRGHSICSPYCQSSCGNLTTSDLCSVVGACQWSTDHCIQDKGANYLQWAQSLSQWAFAAGTGFTVLLPTMRIWIFPILWLFPLAAVCSMAFGTLGMWEFPSAGPWLVGFACLTRFFQGYFEVGQYLYIAFKYGEDAEAATVFVGSILVCMSFLSGSIFSAMISAVNPS